MRLFIIVTFLILTTGCHGMFTKTKEPSYKVVNQIGDVEIREYDALTIAEIKIQKEDRMEAANAGFMPLANYIFAKNRDGETMAMTAPVRQKSIEKGWALQFVMPEEYTLKTLPKSTDSRITLKENPKKKYAVLRFSGRPTDSNVAEHEALLRSIIKQHGLKITGTPLYNYYNPPWTLPFMRRNEIWFELRS